MRLKGLKDWVDELRGIKAEREEAAAEAARRRREEENATPEARRGKQVNALLGEWESVVKRHLTELAKVQWGYQGKIRPGLLQTNGSCGWWVTEHVEYWGNWFKVELHYHFDERNLLVTDKFVVEGKERYEAAVSVSALRDALTKVLRVGPAVPKPYKHSPQPWDGGRP